MAIIVSSLSVDGRSCPWKVGSLASNVNGSSAILVAYNAPNYDGSVTGGGSAGQNTAYPYGKNHTHAGEQSPTTLSVTPGQLLVIQYVSGTINTQGSGAGTCPPAGVAITAAPAPYPSGGCDNTTFPTDVIPGYNGLNFSGTVNTSGTTVTWVSGDKFTNGMVGQTMFINKVPFVISSISTANSATQLTLATSAGTQTGVQFYVYGCQTSEGGLIGTFTDASGNIVGKPFDWASYKGVNPAGAFTLSQVSASGTALANYTGTITGGGTNLLAGYWFTITGFTNARNNGTFLCVANGTTSLTLTNGNMFPETHSGSAQQLSSIMLRVPNGAAFLSLGINDTQEWDNSGTFSLQVIQLDSVGFTGGPPTFARYPYPYGPAVVAPAFSPDWHSTLSATVMMACYPIYQEKNGLSVGGQLYPMGKN